MAERRSRKESRGAGTPADQGGGPGGKIDAIADKIDEIVGKVVPERLLPTVFAGTALVTLLFFILMIVGFARDPGEAAKADIEALETQVEKLEKDLRETRGGKKEAGRSAATFERDLKQAQDQLSRLEENRGRLNKQVEDLRNQLEEARGARKDLDRKLKKAVADASRGEKSVGVASERLKTVETQLGELRKQHDALRRQKDDAAKVYEKARVAFETIVKNVSEIANPEKKVENIERLRAASRPDLEGTVYMDKLDAMVARARKTARREAKVAYADYMNRLKMTVGHESAMKLLAEAKKEFDELDETAYLLKIDQQMKEREEDHSDEVARKVHDDVMKAIASQPKAYEENLTLLKEALEKAKDTRWGARIEGQATSRERTLADDVARAAYEELVSRVRKDPKAYDRNLDFAEEIKPKITARFEKHYAKQVAALEARRLKTLGREALSEAQEHVAKHPKDHEGNIEKILELRKRAAGSPYEPKLAAMLDRERKLLLRAGK